MSKLAELTKSTGLCLLSVGLFNFGNAANTSSLAGGIRTEARQAADFHRPIQRIRCRAVLRGAHSPQKQGVQAIHQETQIIKPNKNDRGI